MTYTVYQVQGGWNYDAYFIIILITGLQEVLVYSSQITKSIKTTLFSKPPLKFLEQHQNYKTAPKHHNSKKHHNAKTES